MVPIATSAGSVSRGTLTPARTPFVGRETELARIHRALESGRRLITLSGPGGVGKSRLVEEVVQTCDLETWTVEVENVDDPDLLPGTLAGVLGLQERPGHALPQVCAYLGARRALIVLDNCEHLLSACAEIAAELVHRCPGVHVMSTSRSALGLPGEQVLHVPALAVPTSTSDLETSEAARLFLARAAQLVPDFRIRDEAAGRAIVALVHALDGLPLALELAAAHMPTFSPESMLADLSTLLKGSVSPQPGSVPYSERHRSVAASVLWSHRLCTSAEKLLWARLSVFVGGFDLTAVEAVCTDNQLPPREVLEALAGLVDKSVVSRVPGGPEPSFRMLETLRQFGRDRLVEEADPGEWERRHHAWCCDLATSFERGWVGPEQPALVARVRRNHANLVTSFDLRRHPERLRTALPAMISLEYYWVVTGRLAEHRAWLDAALEHPVPVTSDRVVALCQCTIMAAIQLDLDYADRRLEEARTAAAAFAPVPEHEGRDSLPHSPELVARAYLLLAGATHAVCTGQNGAAIPLARQGAELFEAAGKLSGALTCLLELGLAASATGRAEDATAVMSRVLELTTERGEVWARSSVLWTMGMNALADGDLDRAEELQRSSLRMKRQVRDELGTAIELEALAAVSSARGDARRSARLLGAASRAWRRIGGSPLAAPYIAAQRELGERIARGELDDSTFLAAYREGEEMPTSAAIDLALGVESAEADAIRVAELSPREEEVAALVGRGLSNQQIADRLYLSVRTVEGHMDSILRKLGFGSRTQVAAWVVDREHA